MPLDPEIPGHGRHLQQELPEERDEGSDQGDPGGELHLPGPHHQLHRGPLRQLRLRRRPAEAPRLRDRPRQRLLPG